MNHTELIMADIVLDDGDVETTYKVDRLVSDYTAKNKQYFTDANNPDNRAEQQGNYDDPTWREFDWYEICGENYGLINDFIRRIAYYEENDLSDITNGELSGNYLAHRYLRQKGEYQTYGDTVLVVYTRVLDRYDENDNEIWEIEATIVEAESRSVGRWQ